MKAKSNEKPAGKHKTGFRGPTPDVGKATQIKPGEVRNPGGKNQYTPITDMYREIFASRANYKAIKEAMLRILVSGRMAAVLLQKEAAERLEGRVVQPVEANVNLSIADVVRGVRERKEEYERSRT